MTTSSGSMNIYSPEGGDNDLGEGQKPEEEDGISYE